MKNRECNIELVRIVAMFCIILYHILDNFIWPFSGNADIYRALQIPVHIGVVLFVLISGYFGIRPSLKGALMLLFTVFFYYVPLQLVYSLFTGDKIGAVMAISFFGNSPYWFVQTYFYLYLFSPILNGFLSNPKTSNHNLLITTILIGGISMYMGLINTDPSISGGKNIVNFVFLYFVGYLIRQYKERIQYIPIIKLLLLFVFLNVLLVVVYVVSPLSFIKLIIIKLSFFYCSPLLIFNAGLIFAVFTKMKVDNIIVNKIAKTTFSMYLIHNHPIVLANVIGLISYWAWSNLPQNVFVVLAYSILFTVLIMTTCFAIDLVCRPVIDCLASFIYKKIHFIGVKLNLISNG